MHLRATTNLVSNFILRSETPFHAACTYGKNPELTAYILDRGVVSINIQGKNSLQISQIIINVLFPLLIEGLIMFRMFSFLRMTRSLSYKTFFTIVSTTILS